MKDILRARCQKLLQRSDFVFVGFTVGTYCPAVPRARSAPPTPPDPAREPDGGHYGTMVGLY